MRAICFLIVKKPFLGTKKHFQSKKWSKWPNFGRNFDISRKMGVLAQSAHFSPKWLHCLGLMSIMPSPRIIMPSLNAPNYSPRPILYSNIYFYILWRGSACCKNGQSCPNRAKNRFWGESHYFYPKMGCFGQKTSERPKCVKNSCLCWSEHNFVP